jgi:hypothetical protein
MRELTEPLRSPEGEFGFWNWNGSTQPPALSSAIIISICWSVSSISGILLAITDVGVAGPIDDAMTQGQHGWPVETFLGPNRDIDLRKDREHQEPVSGRYWIEVTKVGKHDVLVDATVRLKSLVQMDVIGLESSAALVDRGILQNRIDRFVPEQKIQCDLEVLIKGAKTTPRIEGESELDIGLRIQDVVQCQVGRVEAISFVDQLFVVGQGLRTFVVVPNQMCRRRRLSERSFEFDPRSGGCRMHVMVEPHRTSTLVGEIASAEQTRSLRSG